MAKSEGPQEEEDMDEKRPGYKCTNAECRANGATLEDDEVVKEETTGRLTCCYCGGDLSEAQE